MLLLNVNYSLIIDTLYTYFLNFVTFCIPITPHLTYLDCNLDPLDGLREGRNVSFIIIPLHSMLLVKSACGNNLRIAIAMDEKYSNR